MSGRFLGVDPGERRVGLALSDLTGTIASPHSVIDRAGIGEALATLCTEHDVATIVVGLPIGLSGTEGPAAVAARDLAAEVAEVTGLPVVFSDERFTTVISERALVAGGMKRRQRKETRDKVAAAVMLQSYLDGRGRGDAAATGDGTPAAD